MKILKLFVPFALILFLGCNTELEEKPSKIKVAKYRGLSSKFMKELKSTLMKEMSRGGVKQALTVCTDTAQAMTAEFSSKENVLIKRVSLKNRNTLNAPDDFEREGLHYFQSLISEKEFTDSTEYAEKIEKNGTKTIRYLKPILIQGPCLSCHGDETQVMPEVAELIKKAYPDDKALNYKVGELRGAVSIVEVVD